tara:strand:- start:2954 stop:3220 length:267 start_codon:yes stop_codon:yes gene_type:complete
MPYCFPYEDDDEQYEFMILNIFITVDEEMEREGIKYSLIRDLSKSHDKGRWVALSRKEIEKHIPIGSSIVEELVDMTLNAKKPKGLND